MCTQNKQVIEVTETKLERESVNKFPSEGIWSANLKQHLNKPSIDEQKPKGRGGVHTYLLGRIKD